MGEKVFGVEAERVMAAIRWAEQGPHDGEPRIQAGLAPGGMVFQSWHEGRMVRQHAISATPSEDLARAAAAELGEAAAEADFALLHATGKPIEVRCYDGDTGAWIMTRLIGVRPR